MNISSNNIILSILLKIKLCKNIEDYRLILGKKK